MKLQPRVSTNSASRTHRHAKPFERWKHGATLKHHHKPSISFAPCFSRPRFAPTSIHIQKHSSASINKGAPKPKPNDYLPFSREGLEVITPKCPVFALCGGCSIMDIKHEDQIKVKQEQFLDLLQQNQVVPKKVLDPIYDDPFGYRRKARLGVKGRTKKPRPFVGFRQRGGGDIVDTEACEILHPVVGYMIGELRDLIAELEVRNTMPQIELAVGEEAQLALIFRHVSPISDDDVSKLRAFGYRHNGVHIYLQYKGQHDIVLLKDNEVRRDHGRFQEYTPIPVHKIDDWMPHALSYQLPNFGLRLYFLPNDFTQTNFNVNRKLVDRVVSLVEPNKTDRILDLFCGLGNFALPLARQASVVIGVEGDAHMSRRAADNARVNEINNAHFVQVDLYKQPLDFPFPARGFNKVVCDPPRTGIHNLISVLPQFGTERIVYVSCNPLTFINDAFMLSQNGYELSTVSIADMYSHTDHVEVIGSFDRKRRAPTAVNTRGKRDGSKVVLSSSGTKW